MSDPKNSPQAGSDLPPDLVHRLESLHARLGTIDHYTLLGVPRSATRAQVRQAFLSLAPQFHPDKYFGKTLGPYAAKMQRVFAQLSAAHDTLVNDERRAEYTRGLPPPLPPLPGQRPPLPSSPEPTRPPSFTNEAPSTPMRAATPATPMSPEAARARQQAFASRLAGQGGARMRPGTPVTAFQSGVGPTADGPRRPSSTTLPAVDSKAAVEALRRRYAESVAHSREKQSQEAAQVSESAAAKAKAKEEQLAAAIAKAKDSEQKQDYGDAGVSWGRAFELAPSADIAHRAALCFRRGGADLRRAAKFGEEAVKLDPNRAAYRINLALVYSDLGLALRARGEIERAQALEPGNPQLKDAIARIKAMKQ